MINRTLDNRYFPLILDILDQGVFTVDKSTCITSFNRSAEEITGYSARDVLGVKCAEIFRTNMCDRTCPLRTSIQSQSPVKNRQVYIRARAGHLVPTSVSTSPLVTRKGKLLGGVEVFKDMSRLMNIGHRVDSRYRLIDMIGKSCVMQKIFDLLPLVANSDSTVLVTGASGTGKELIARTIHVLGSRRKGPFVAINCAAIPETLLEAELFGHKKGAFTDAKRDRPGRIAAAEGGTLFLDEIGDLPKAMQVKVLRFLEEHRYEPLGSNRSVAADVRIITATNRNLESLVQAGSFREDLYFRINVLQIDIPPLAQRPEDIPLLVDHYVKIFRDDTGKSIEGLSEAAMACIMAYSFPGNVRELENIIERAFILCQAIRIGPEHLPSAVTEQRIVIPYRQKDTVRAGEIASLKTALERHRGNKTRAAMDLGIHRITLLRRMQRLGLK